MKHRNFIDWCAKNGHAAVVAPELRKIAAKKKFRQGFRYKNPLPVREHFNDKRQYYRTIYLESDHWKELRGEKLRRNPVCERCGSKKRPDVHHLNYRNLYDVQVSDLQTLCRGCHKLEHRNTSLRHVDSRAR